MTKMEKMELEKYSQQSQKILASLEKSVGMIPNMYYILAHSHSALKGFVDMDSSFTRGEFNPYEEQAIKLAVSESYGSEYCISVHTALAKMLGISERETLEMRSATSKNIKIRVLTLLAKEIVRTQGKVEQQLLKDFFEAGYSKAALVELIGIIALKTYTYYINTIAGTPIDFPKAAQLTNQSPSYEGKINGKMTKE